MRTFVTFCYVLKHFETFYSFGNIRHLYMSIFKNCNKKIRYAKYADEMWFSNFPWALLKKGKQGRARMSEGEDKRGQARMKVSKGKQG